jgi:hypothetical protein
MTTDAYWYRLSLRQADNEAADVTLTPPQPRFSST